MDCAGRSAFPSLSGTVNSVLCAARSLSRLCWTSSSSAVPWRSFLSLLAASSSAVPSKCTVRAWLEKPPEPSEHSDEHTSNDEDAREELLAAFVSSRRASSTSVVAATSASFSSSEADDSSARTIESRARKRHGIASAPPNPARRGPIRQEQLASISLRWTWWKRMTK